MKKMARTALSSVDSEDTKRRVTAQFESSRSYGVLRRRDRASDHENGLVNRNPYDGPL